MPQIHFNLVALTAPNNHVQTGWAHPEDRQGEGLWSPDYWNQLARTLERGRFDGIFFADTFSSGASGPDGVAEGSVPRPDPLMLVPMMAQVTTHLGFAVTLSTVGTPPFLAVRRLGTVDNLTGGRLAWNVVTSYQESDFKVLGLERPEHDSRYDQADDYMEIAYRLWDAFPRDAVIMDKASGCYIDPSKIHRVNSPGNTTAATLSPTWCARRRAGP